MRGLFSTIALILLISSAQAQSPSVRVAGTIGKLDGNTLTVATKDGTTATVTLADNAAIYGVEKRTLTDIKPGDFVA